MRDQKENPKFCVHISFPCKILFIVIDEFKKNTEQRTQNQRPNQENQRPENQMTPRKHGTKAKCGHIPQELKV